MPSPSSVMNSCVHPCPLPGKDLSDCSGLLAIQGLCPVWGSVGQLSEFMCCGLHFGRYWDTAVSSGMILGTEDLPLPIFGGHPGVSRAYSHLRDTLLRGCLPKVPLRARLWASFSPSGCRPHCPGPTAPQPGPAQHIAGMRSPCRSIRVDLCPLLPLCASLCLSCYLLPLLSCFYFYF